MRILVPVDGSKYSHEALRTAAELVRSKSADISVISVAPFIGGMEDHEISPSRKQRHMDELETRAAETLKNACEILAAEGLTSSCAKTIVTSVSVPDAIIDFAESDGTDLIVMGSRGLSSSSRIKMGSVASQVVKYGPCSVYLVKLPNE